MQGEIIHCPICGITHGFSERCPTRWDIAHDVDALRRDVIRLRVLLRETLPTLDAAQDPVAARVRHALGDSYGT